MAPRSTPWAARSAASRARRNGASRSTIWPSMARSKACTTTASAISRQSDVRRFYGDVGYRNDSSEFHLNMGVANNKFGASAHRAGRIAAAILGRDLHDAADHHQPRRLCQFDRQGRGDADLDHRRHRRMCACSTRRRWTAIRPTPSHARRSDAALLWRRLPRRPMASMAFSSPIPSRRCRARRDRSHHNAFDHGGRIRCRPPTATSCSGMRTASWSAPASIPASRVSRASAEFGTIGPNYVVTGSGIFLGQSGDPTSIGPVSLRTINQYRGSMRSTRST